VWRCETGGCDTLLEFPGAFPIASPDLKPHLVRVKLLKPIICLGFAILAVVIAGCDKTQSAPANGTPPPATNAQSAFEAQLPKQAQPKLPTIKVWVGAEELVTEMCLTSVQQMTGMMWRTNLAENEAMIFVHPAPRQAGYWMKNCFVPLSIAYLDTAGVILEIHDMQPHDTNSVVSAATDVRFALETRQGWFQRHKISPGAVVRTERGSLAETFLRR
jgi:uncharacterized membrane protein (UPF0127 family)